MSKSLSTLLLTAATILTHMPSAAQDIQPQTSRFDVGIENTRLLYGQYTYKGHYTARLNISAYSEKLAYQYVRASLGYQTSVACLGLSGKAFYGTAFNGSYYNAGVAVSAAARVAGRLLLDATVSPWYDSGYGYTTCWQATVGCVITSGIDIKAGYTTMPEYRMSEKRILAGFDFHVSRLYVSPCLSIGTKASEGGKNVRVVFGFGYRF